jgi:hypothetical protein
MNNPGNDQNPPEPPAADGGPPAPAEDLELIAPRECPDCRPGALDPLRCRAEGVKAEAAYDEQHKDGPSPEKYETARLEYGKARHDARPVVAEVRDQLTHITDQLRCLIDDSETVECLDEAWLEVKERLEVCDPQLGCCVDDEGDFDTEVSECGIETLKARIAEYEHRTDAAEACFTKLLAEPQALTQRVAALQAEVAGITSTSGSDDTAADQQGQTAAPDYKRQYAAALVARRHLEEIWWGFDHPHDYVDCLCLALRISLRGRVALSRLNGELAVRTCRQKARHDRCEHLREKIAEAIIEEYVRRCHPRHWRDHDGEHRYDHDHEHRYHPDDDRDDDDDDRDHRRRDDDRDRDRDRDRHDRDRYRDEDRDRERDRDRDRDRDRYRDDDRDRDRYRDRERRHRDRDRYRDAR